MANSEFLKKLINAHYNNDQTQFRSAVLQIAAAESSAGHTALASELKDLTNKGSIGKQIYAMQHNDSLCMVTMADNREEELVVSDDVRVRLDRILQEYREREKLRSYGLKNRSRIMLEGMPGTGKTLTASILAGELHLPLYQIQMDRLITKFMGETSAKLRRIFDQINAERGVYLFDEFDAIGADRTYDNEVGEMRRVLNTFLKFMEEDNSDSLILAATNNKKMLDQALFRRFDDVLHYTMPDKEQIQKLFEIKLSTYYFADCITSEVMKQADGLSHAEITRACEECIKTIILNNERLTPKLLIKFLNERTDSYEIKEA